MLRGGAGVLASLPAAFRCLAARARQVWGCSPATEPFQHPFLPIPWGPLGSPRCQAAGAAYSISASLPHRYIERKAFLERVDHRQFEIERDIRLSRMKP